MTATIKDVAKLANVSPSTVSRVISNNPKISAPTVAKVKSAMEELNYQPNQIARSLTNKSTKTLGLIIPGSEDELLDNPFFIQMIRGVISAAKNKNYYVLLTYARYTEDPVDVISELLSSRWVDGIILTTIQDNDSRVALLKERQHPYVIIGRPDNESEGLWVDNDNILAMENVVDHLIQLGHQSIAFIGGPEKFHVTIDRLKGYKNSLAKHQLSIDNNMIYFSKYNENNAFETASQLLKHHQPDAIVTTDDLIAFGVQRYFHENQIQDISLIGFNNSSLSQYKNPSISSVDIKAQELGKQATLLLIDSILDVSLESNHSIIETELIERDTIINRSSNKI